MAPETLAKILILLPTLTLPPPSILDFVSYDQTLVHVMDGCGPTTLTVNSLEHFLELSPPEIAVILTTPVFSCSASTFICNVILSIPLLGKVTEYLLSDASQPSGNFDLFNTKAIVSCVVPVFFTVRSNVTVS